MVLNWRRTVAGSGSLSSGSARSGPRPDSNLESSNGFVWIIWNLEHHYYHDRHHPPHPPHDNDDVGQQLLTPPVQPLLFMWAAPRLNIILMCLQLGLPLSRTTTRFTCLGAKASKVLKRARSPGAAAEGEQRQPWTQFEGKNPGRGLRRTCRAPGRRMASETGERAPSIGSDWHHDLPHLFPHWRQEFSLKFLLLKGQHGDGYQIPRLPGIKPNVSWTSPIPTFEQKLNENFRFCRTSWCTVRPMAVAMEASGRATTMAPNRWESDPRNMVASVLSNFLGMSDHP